MDRAIDAAMTLRTPLNRIREALSAGTGDSVATGCSRMTAQSRRQSELLSDLGARAEGCEAIRVELGEASPLESEDGSIILPLRWQATGLCGVFPEFDGELQAVAEAGGTTLRLSGIYTVPLGPHGRFGDGLAGRRLAHQAVVALLHVVAAHLEEEPREGPTRPTPASGREISWRELSC